MPLSDALTDVKPGMILSVITTFSAAFGPLFEVTIVYVTGLPAVADVRPSFDVTRSALAAPTVVTTLPPDPPGGAAIEPLLLVSLGSGVSDRLDTTLVMLVRLGGAAKLMVRLWLLPLAKEAIAGNTIAPVAAL